VRAIETNVLADDGQIVVLGGLIEDTEGDGEEKVRGLGDIPILGNLFKYRSRNRTKTNLMVFLRPVVVRSKEASASLAMDRYEYMRGVGAAGQTQQESVLMRDLGAPLLPPLTNGQPPTGGAMATTPVQTTPAAGSAPGAASGQPVPQGQQAQPQQRPGSQFRPVTPSNQK
jgi:general secretion pathway protein D